MNNFKLLPPPQQKLRHKCLTLGSENPILEGIRRALSAGLGKRKTPAALAFAALNFTGFLPAAQADAVTGNDNEGVVAIENNNVVKPTDSTGTPSEGVYGWYYPDDVENTEAVGGRVTITGSTLFDNSSDEVTVIGGYVEADSTVTYNYRNTQVNNPSISLLGGTANANTNEVYILGNSTVTGDVYGGRAETESTVYVEYSGSHETISVSTQDVTICANANEVYIFGNSTVTGSVYGGYAFALGNTTSVIGKPGSASNPAFSTGGDTINFYAAPSGTANDNKVYISFGTVNDSVYGGLSCESANNNYVEIFGSKVGSSNTDAVYGGRVNAEMSVSIIGFGYEIESVAASANNNTVNIHGTSTVTGGVYGGYAAGSSTLNFSNTSKTGIADEVIATANENTIKIYDSSTVTGEIYGGYAEALSTVTINIPYTPSADFEDAEAYANNNNIYISDSKVTGDIYGGFAKADSSFSVTTASTSSQLSADSELAYAFANENAVTITDSSTINGNIIGGYATASTKFLFSTSLYSAFSATGDVGLAEAYANTNTVNILEGSNVIGAVFGGYTSAAVNVEITVYNNGQAGTASDEDEEDYAHAYANENEVYIDKSEVTGDVYGGYAEAAAAVSISNYSSGTAQGDTDDALAEADGNLVSVTGGSTIEGDIYGGYAEASSQMTLTITGSGAITGDTEDAFAYADNNTVYIEESEVTGDIYGGSAYAFSSFDVTVGTSIPEEVTGDAEAAYAYAEGNTAAVTGSTITGDIYGGYAYAKTNFAVTLSDSATLAGGVTDEEDSTTASAEGNYVYIREGSEVDGNVYGGRAIAEANVDVPDSVEGSATAEAAADGNAVYIYNGTVTGKIYGGYAEAKAEGKITGTDSATQTSYSSTGSGTAADAGTAEASASGNYVYIFGGTLKDDIIGGHAVADISLSTGDTSIADNVSVSAIASATDNYVYILGGTIEGDIYGGSVVVNAGTSGADTAEEYSIDTKKVFDAFTGNTLNIVGYCLR